MSEIEINSEALNLPSMKNEIESEIENNLNETEVGESETEKDEEAVGEDLELNKSVSLVNKPAKEEIRETGAHEVGESETEKDEEAVGEDLELNKSVSLVNEPAKEEIRETGAHEVAVEVEQAVSEENQEKENVESRVVNEAKESDLPAETELVKNENEIENGLNTKKDDIKNESETEAEQESEKIRDYFAIKRFKSENGKIIMERGDPIRIKQIK